MNEQRRAIVISTGMNNLELISKLKQSEVLTGESLQRITGLYEKLAAKKAAIEAAENDASLARLAKNMTAKEAIYRASLEKQAAMSAIASGSGGAGSGFRTAEQIALEGGESAAAGAAGAKLAGAGAKEVAKEAHGLAGIMRESGVLMREGMRGNFTKMIGSFTLLAGMISSYMLPIIAAVAGIAELLPRLWGGATLSGTYKAYEDSQVSGREVAIRSADRAEDLKDIVRRLEKTGQINEKQSRSMLKTLHDPTYENVMAIDNQVTPLMKELKARERITYLENLSADHAKQKVEAEKQAKELLEKQAEIQNRLRHLYREHDQIYKDAQREGVNTPSLENLAGRSYMQKLNAYFGAGGAMDLSAGTGPYAKAAQDALYFKNKTTYDLENGLGGFDANGNLFGLAKEDRDRARANENLLGAAGLDTPAMKFEAMKEHLAFIADQIFNLSYAERTDGLTVQLKSK